MIIHPRPDQEFKINEAIQSGLIENEEALLDLGLETLEIRLLAEARKSAEKPKRNKTLVELFSPLRGFELNFERNPSSSRLVEL
jgi:hypothetical protein